MYYAIVAISNGPPESLRQTIVYPTIVSNQLLFVVIFTIAVLKSKCL